MDVSRRAFIKLITAAVAGGAVLDVDKLLWVPKPMIVVPALPVAEDFARALTFRGGSWLEWMNYETLRAAGFDEPEITGELAARIRRGLLSADEMRRLARA